MDGVNKEVVVTLEKEKSSAVAKGRSFTDSITGMEFVWVPGGCFDMGGGINRSERPVHEVCLDGFWMGKYEVTQDQWQALMSHNPSFNKWGGRYPVEHVSWIGVKEYIRKLQKKTGKQFRLPTEAEWEYACRSGGRKEKYCGGDNIDTVAWHEGNSMNKHHTVGKKKSNGLGLYDMSGNVAEWCQDRYGKSYYQSSPNNNPQGPLNGSDRAVRGGSYASYPSRAVNRMSSWERKHSFLVGFRLVLPVRSLQATQ